MPDLIFIEIVCPEKLKSLSALNERGLDYYVHQSGQNLISDSKLGILWRKLQPLKYPR